eukprot:5595200-Prymnesium_polylepis.1
MVRRARGVARPAADGRPCPRRDPPRGAPSAPRAVGPVAPPRRRRARHAARRRTPRRPAHRSDGRLHLAVVHPPLLAGRAAPRAAGRARRRGGSDRRTRTSGACHGAEPVPLQPPRLAAAPGGGP